MAIILSVRFQESFLLRHLIARERKKRCRERETLAMRLGKTVVVGFASARATWPKPIRLAAG
jgi:hypothetical protein